MASLSKEAHGGRQVQFVDMNGKRRSIRLGRIPLKQADAILIRIESLVSAKAGNTPIDSQTAAWVKEIGDTLHERLSRTGLVVPRGETQVTLTTMFERWLDSLSIKVSTKLNYESSRRAIESHFGKDRLLSTISVADAEAFKRAMRQSGKSQATVAKYLKAGRQMFRRAVKLKLVAEDPFAEVPVGSQTNDARLRFISRDLIAGVMEACPDNEWRLLIALSRFGGLRCPSEHLALRWADIDWERRRITVNSPKTEGHDHGETRVIPLFPELVPYLEQAQKEDTGASELVLTARYRRSDCYQRYGVNLGTQFRRIIRRAGIEPWPRVWHNLRASRETELAERFPLHVVCRWLGNTSTVAAKSYLSIRESDFEHAAKTDESPVQKAVQNPVQHAAETARKARNR